jgi:hypothetical protein
VLTAVSQPLRVLPSQLPQPLLHVGAQLPLAQLVLPCGLVQPAPQLPQCAAFVASVTSQPLAAFVSQFAYPELQPPTPHAPLVQLGVPLAVVHTLLQKPQSATEPVSGVSQSD